LASVYSLAFVGSFSSKLSDVIRCDKNRDLGFDGINGSTTRASTECSGKRMDAEVRTRTGMPLVQAIKRFLFHWYVIICLGLILFYVLAIKEEMKHLKVSNTLPEVRKCKAS